MLQIINADTTNELVELTQVTETKNIVEVYVTAKQNINLKLCFINKDFGNIIVREQFQIEKGQHVLRPKTGMIILDSIILLASAELATIEESAQVLQSV